jgi:hypothetical protein
MTALFLRLAIGGVAVFSASYFLGGFSESQSITLAVLAVLFYWAILTAAKTQRFVPYSVLLQPNLYAIVKDLGLVEDTKEAWAEIRAGIEKLPKEPSNIWDSGFSFSFVTPELIYVKNLNRFATQEIDLFASLAPVTIPRRSAKFDEMFGPSSPDLSLKASRDIGCILTLTLPDWFWEQIKEKESFKQIPKSDVTQDHMCGTVDVRLVRIPAQEFDVHAALADARYRRDGTTKEVKARNEARLRYGWKGKSHRDMYGNESGEELSDVAEHKYCSVYHDPI